MHFRHPLLPAMLAMSTTTTIFASPLAQLTPDPLGAFVQDTISSARQHAQANPGSSQISVCNNGVCTHNPSALPGGAPALNNNNAAAPGGGSGTSSVTVNTGNGKTVQGANQVAPPLAPPRKGAKKPARKAPGAGAKKAPKLRRRQRLPDFDPYDPHALTAVARAKANAAAIDRAVAQQEAATNPGSSSSSSSSSTVTHTDANQAATGPDQVAPPETEGASASEPAGKQKQKQKKHGKKHQRPPTHPAGASPRTQRAPGPLRRRFLDGATSAAQALAFADGMTSDSPAPAPASGGWQGTDSSTVMNTGGQSAQGLEQVSPARDAGRKKPSKGGKPARKGKGKGMGMGGGVMPKGKAKLGKLPVRVRRAVGEGWGEGQGYAR
ncbi:hypothetical protein MMC26_000122 [Xylographa opegraphella]|nr:hypothetical protein [Xylographa opegraphella]